MAQDYSRILNQPEIIAWSKKYLRKRNRIEWYLKIVREFPSVHPCEGLRHYYSMNIPEIEAYLPIKSLGAVLEDLNNIEQEYLAKQSANLAIISPSPIESIFMDCQEGFFWVNLNTSESPEEGKAMGHCGNRIGAADDTILSLRKEVIKAGKRYWEPHLTFILKGNNILGERKGKQNHKPHKKYHPQILQLLSDPRILGMESNVGYLPQNNFMYGDLSESDKNYCLEKYSEKMTKIQKQVLRNYRNIEYIVDCNNYKEIQEMAHYDLSWIKESYNILDIFNKTKHIEIKRTLFRYIEDYQTIEYLIEKEDFIKNYSFSTIFRGVVLSEEQKYNILKLTYGHGGALWSSILKELPKNSKENYLTEIFFKEFKNINKIHSIIDGAMEPLDNKFWLSLMRQKPQYTGEITYRMFDRMRSSLYEGKDKFILEVLDIEERRIFFSKLKYIDEMLYFFSMKLDEKSNEILISKICNFNLYQMIGRKDRDLFLFKNSDNWELFKNSDLKMKNGIVKELINVNNYLKEKNVLGKIKALEKQISILESWDVGSYVPWNKMTTFNKILAGISIIKRFLRLA